MKCLVIVNPVSGGGKAKPYVMDLLLTLNELFDTIEIKFTEGAGDAVRFAREATIAGYEAVICMGGDGTVNETVNGIAQGGGGAKFGFVPVGTVNDLARALHIPLHPLEAIQMLATADTLSLDIGRCNDSYFCNNIAAGHIPKVVEEVTAKEKALLGPLAYFVKGGQALLKNKNFTFHVTTEKEDITVQSPLVLALMTNCVSSFEQFLPMAEVNDGYMRIIIFKEYFLMEVLKIIPLILSGKIYNSKYVTILTAEKASITIEDDNTELTTNMDGSRGPLLPVNLKVLPSFLTVYVPAGTEHHAHGRGME